MLQVFQFEQKDILCLGTWDKPEWVANDVVDVLYPEAAKTNRSNYLRKVPAKWKGIKRIMTPGGEQDVVTLLEPGLYFFINRSNSPNAQPFQDWLYEEVLPSIRKTGKYDPGNQSGQKALPPLNQENRIRVMELAVKTLELRHDERLLMAVQAEAKNIMEGTSQPEENKLLSVTEWVGTFGYRVPKGKDSVLGRKVAARWRLQYNCEPKTAPKYVGTNHQAENIKVYPQEFLPVIVEETEDYCNIRLEPMSEA